VIRKNELDQVMVGSHPGDAFEKRGRAHLDVDHGNSEPEGERGPGGQTPVREMASQWYTPKNLGLKREPVRVLDSGANEKIQGKNPK